MARGDKGEMAQGPRVYGGKSGEERHEARRQRLHAAGLELFADVGYAGSSVEQICSKASVSTRHFYQLYRQKEDLLIDLYSALTDRSVKAVQQSLDDTRGAPTRDRLAAAVGAYLDTVLSDTRVARVAFVAIVGVSPRMEDRRLEFRELLVALVESEAADAVAAGELPEQDYRFLALAFIGAANVVVHDWSVRSGADAASVREQLCDLASGMMTGQYSPR